MEALVIHAEQDMALSQKSPSEGGDDGSPADECLDGGQQGWGCGSPCLCALAYVDGRWDTQEVGDK